MGSSCFQLICASESSSKSVAFRGIRVESMIVGSLAKTHIEQRFVNEGANPVEVLYEFPLPLAGILLHLNIILGERVLTGIVKGRTLAEANYEDAIVEGNSAFLLKELSQGLYQISLGNLLPGELAIIGIDYAEVLDPVGSSLRYRLPTVIAPHYGNSQDLGLQPQDVPVSDLAAQYPVEVRMTISDGGTLIGPVKSPTHRINTVLSGQNLVVQLAGSPDSQAMDRDFIIMIPQSGETALTLWRQSRSGNDLCLGILTSAKPNLAVDTPLTLTILMDCSGSMTGDSIEQARIALSTIIDSLGNQDRIAILCFGSEVSPWMKEPVTLTETMRTVLKAQAEDLSADMGGTEIKGAIEHALHITPKGGQILLVTDGESYVSDQQLEAYAQSGRRFFTIGVGSSVSERLVRDLANRSEGFCELVTPNEDMHTRIVQQMVRMRQPRQPVSVNWGDVVPVHTHSPEQLFLGETLLFSAILPESGTAEVEVVLGRGEEATILDATAISPPEYFAGDFSRMVAWHQLPLVDSDEAEGYAVAHQLLTDRTAIIAVMAREDGEQSDGLPEMVKIPQMLSAGWGGAGSVTSRDVVNCASKRSVPRFSRRQSDMSCDEAGSYEASAFLRLGDTEMDDALSTDDFSKERAASKPTVVSPSELLYQLNAVIQPKSPLPWKRNYPESIETYISHLLREPNITLPEELENLLNELSDRYLTTVAKNSKRAVILKELVRFLLDDLEGFKTREYRPLWVVLRRQSWTDGHNSLLAQELSKALKGTTGNQWAIQFEKLGS